MTWRRFNPNTVGDDMEALVRQERESTSPVDVAFARMNLSHLNWALIHDTTERLVGDPDWWKRAFDA